MYVLGVKSQITHYKGIGIGNRIYLKGAIQIGCGSDSGVLPKNFSANGMFLRTSYAHDLALWDLPLSVNTREMFFLNPQGLRVQSMQPWTVLLHVESGDIPDEPYWKKLFAQLLPMGQALGLTPIQQTQAIWDAHLGLEMDAFVAPSEQSVGALF